MSLSPAANIAVTVATAMAKRGDNVGPNVTLVLLAELEASQVLLESRDQRITQLEEAIAELQADHRRSPTFPLQLWKSWHTLDALQAGAEADPDVAETAWALIDHHAQHRTPG